MLLNKTKYTAIKGMSVWDNVSVKYNPIHWSPLSINWLVSMWFWTLTVNGLNSLSEKTSNKCYTAKYHWKMLLKLMDPDLCFSPVNLAPL